MSGEWIAIARVRSGGSSSEILYSTRTRGLAYGEGRTPISAAQIAALDGQGALVWGREDVRAAVLDAVAGPAVPPEPVTERRKGDAGRATRAGWYAWIAAAAILALSAALVGWALLSGGQREASSPEDLVRAHLLAIDAAVDGRDVDAYGSLVDLDAFGGIMASATVEAYRSLPDGVDSRAGEAGVLAGYDGYAKGVLAAVASGDAGGVPLYGLADGDYAVEGSVVAVSVSPGPLAGETGTAPRSSVGAVIYVFDVSSGKPKLVGVDGLAPYLTHTAAVLSGYGQD